VQVEDLYLPVDLLNNLVIVDTPGTNAVIKRCGLVTGPMLAHVPHRYDECSCDLRHAQLTHRIVPRADVVIFLTSVLRPFSDSERIFLEKVCM
jgi:hypothetical protein